MRDWHKNIVPLPVATSSGGVILPGHRAGDIPARSLGIPLLVLTTAFGIHVQLNALLKYVFVFYLLPSNACVSVYYYVGSALPRGSSVRLSASQQSLDTIIANNNNRRTYVYTRKQTVNTLNTSVTNSKKLINRYVRILLFRNWCLRGIVGIGRGYFWRGSTRSIWLVGEKRFWSAKSAYK